MEVHETAEERRNRTLKGIVVAVLCVLWWVASIGGVIYTINTTG